MDLIPHGLAGALVAGALLPDVDVVIALVDELSVVRYHRGLTHSLVAACGLSSAPARRRRIRPTLSRRPVRWSIASWDVPCML